MGRAPAISERCLCEKARRRLVDCKPFCLPPFLFLLVFAFLVGVGFLFGHFFFLCVSLVLVLPLCLLLCGLSLATPGLCVFLLVPPLPPLPSNSPPKGWPNTYAFLKSVRLGVFHHACFFVGLSAAQLFFSSLAFISSFEGLGFR